MMVIPRAVVEKVITDALSEAKRVNKPQYVRAMNWDDLYGDIGFTDDPQFQIGKLHATVNPDGSIERHWIPHQR